MSYCKRNLDGSEVYMYPSGLGTPVPDSPIVCQYCALQPSGDALLYTHAAALEHLLEHRHAGHTVPDAAIERLRREVAASETLCALCGRECSPEDRSQCWRCRRDDDQLGEER